MDYDDDNDDRPAGEVLPSDSLHVLEPSHSNPEHASQPNADAARSGAVSAHSFKKPSPG
jgi:hypothetical protein